MKICAKCSKTKELSAFSRDKTRKGGLFSYCKECKKLSDSKYYSKNRNSIREKQAQYIAQNIQRIRKVQKAYILSDPNKWRLYQKEYGLKNKVALNEKKKTYQNKRRKTDIKYRLIESQRSRVNKFLKEKSKSVTTKELLGCSLDYFKKYLEDKFQFGMTWDNYGDWEIDHIYPFSKAKSLEDLKILFHYSNTQPLWAANNLLKSNKTEE